LLASLVIILFSYFRACVSVFGKAEHIQSHAGFLLSRVQLVFPFSF
jgi:hypothetical protein